MHQPVEHRSTIEADLIETARHARRQMYVVKRFTEDPDTDWDAAHDWINALLDEWEMRA